MQRVLGSINLWSWIIVLVVYFSSMLLPAVYQAPLGAPGSGSDGSVLPGYEMLMEVPMNMLSFGWWANPVLIIGLFALATPRNRLALSCGIIATLLASLVMLFGAFPPDRFRFTDFKQGYFVWLSSMILLLGFAAIQLLQKIPNAKS